MTDGDPLAPLRALDPPWTLGQMGQSLDGFIATRTGASHYITGDASLVHLHRLRGLCDAVVVGWRTVESDDPRLTVRRVSGSDPARVIVDVRGELDSSKFQAFSPGAPVLYATGEGVESPLGIGEHAEHQRFALADGRIDPLQLIEALRARGWSRILVEGGGSLVSSFLRAGALDRLHVVVAPLLVGGGRPGVQPSPVDDLRDALRPPARIFAMGDDVLFDLDLRSGAGS